MECSRMNSQGAGDALQRKKRQSSPDILYERKRMKYMVNADSRELQFGKILSYRCRNNEELSLKDSGITLGFGASHDLQIGLHYRVMFWVKR